MRTAIRLAGALVVAAGIGWFLLGRLAPVVEPLPGGASTGARSALRYALADSICGCGGPAVNPVCHTRVYFPDSTAGRSRVNAPVIVLLHGFTNCPKQFDRLAREFSRRGYTVIVPLLPRHGMADVMTTELGRLNAEELVRAGERSLDVADALGSRVTVVGLSSSAVLAAWLAQHRPDVACAVLIAPALGPKGMPAPLVRPVTGVLLRLPNFFVWWDSKLRDRNPGPRQCYPRFASHAIAQVYRLGAAVLHDAGREKPRAKRIVVVTTAEDEAVSNERCADLVRLWRARGARVETFQFPSSMRVHHDMIDPEQPYQRTEVVDPVLIRLVMGSDSG